MEWLGTGVEAYPESFYQSRCWSLVIFIKKRKQLGWLSFKRLSLCNLRNDSLVCSQDPKGETKQTCRNIRIHCSYGLRGRRLVGIHAHYPLETAVWGSTAMIENRCGSSKNRGSLPYSDQAPRVLSCRNRRNEVVPLNLVGCYFLLKENTVWLL